MPYVVLGIVLLVTGTMAYAVYQRIKEEKRKVESEKVDTGLASIMTKIQDTLQDMDLENVHIQELQVGIPPFNIKIKV